MKWHIMEGEEGCAFAVRGQCVAIVVDALRASTMAAMMLHHGATEIISVLEVEQAIAAREEAYPDALLAGERDGLPPAGFDLGNSPLQAAKAKGLRVVFTTTTGTGRLLACWGSAAVYMGTTVNAAAVGHAAAGHGRDVVVIPAGCMGNPGFNAQEDLTAAAFLVMKQEGARLGEGDALFQHWRARILDEGLPRLFETAPHADLLRRAGLDADIAFCAQADITATTPRGVARNEWGIVLRGE